MALEYISGENVPQKTLATEMSTTPPKMGTALSYMKIPFVKRGYDKVASHRACAISDLKYWILKQYVSIIDIWMDQTKKETHYIVVVGFSPTGIYVKDPSVQERRYIENEDLLKLWKVEDETWALEIPYPPPVITTTLRSDSFTTLLGPDNYYYIINLATSKTVGRFSNQTITTTSNIISSITTTKSISMTQEKKEGTSLEALLLTLSVGVSLCLALLYRKTKSNQKQRHDESDRQNQVNLNPDDRQPVRPQ